MSRIRVALFAALAALSLAACVSTGVQPTGYGDWPPKREFP